jgi:hypothetical protein
MDVVEHSTVERFQERVLVVEVGVEAAHSGVEPGGERRHRQLAQTVCDHDLFCRLQDLLLRE